MNNKVIAAIIAVVVVVSIGAFLLLLQSSTHKTQSSNTSVKDTSIKEKKVGNATYTLAEVKKHDSSEDCWIGIEGKVYDVTKYISEGKHPGGTEILKGCGIDATGLFNSRPDGTGAHSVNTQELLKDFYIGDLKG